MTSTPAPKRRKRWLVWAGLGMVAALALIAFLLPYLLKRYIETHSEEWIGRKVTVDLIVLNPFTLKYGVYGLTCHEPNSATVFVSWDEVSLRTDLWDGFRNEHWRFNTVRIRAPYFHIAQRGDRFNFSDLMELGSADTVPSADPSSVRFNMEDISISGGRIDYYSDVLRAPVQVAGLEAGCTRITSEDSRMTFRLGFDLVSGGRLDGGFMIDPGTSTYGIDAELKGFLLPQLLPYLQDFFACRELGGSLDLRLNVLDNYADTTSLLLSAGLALDNVELTDPQGLPLFTLDHASAALDTMIARTGQLEVGRVLLDGAAIHYSMFADGSDNWTRNLKLDSTATAGDSVTLELQASESNVFLMLADYVSYLGQQMIASEYTADSLALVNSTIKFEDHTPALPFNYAISDITVSSQRVTSGRSEGTIRMAATLNSTGQLEADAVFDPGDLRNVVLDMKVTGMDLSHLDPYVRWYAAHPMESGMLGFTTHTVIHGGMIDARNTIHVDKLKIGKKVEEHDPEATVLPLRLATGLLKDVNGVVAFDLPVQGDLKDPEFRMWPLVWQVVKNLLLKAVSAPGRLLLRAVEGADEDDLEQVRFDPLQTMPEAGQRKTLKQLASVLKDRSDMRVDLVPIVDAAQEQQEAAVFMAKSRYLFGGERTLSGADSLRVREVSTRDTLFTAFVEQETPAMAGRSLHDRAVALIGADVPRAIADQVEAARKEHVMQLLLQEGMPPHRVRFRAGTAEELAGRQGLPGYRFIFDVPEEDPAQEEE